MADFSDCDEQLLIQCADEMEKNYKQMRKRKANTSLQDESNKKLKLLETFACKICGRSYQGEKGLKRHEKTHTSTFPCLVCSRTFTRKDNMRRHEKICTMKSLICKHCPIPFPNDTVPFQHIAELHPLHSQRGAGTKTSADKTLSNEKQKTSLPKENRFHSRKSAINDKANSVEISPQGNEMFDLLQFLANIKQHLIQELQKRRSLLRNIKWYVNARVEMARTVAEGKEEMATPHFRSKAYIALDYEDQEDNVNKAFQEVNRALEEFIRKGSNWTVNKVICLEIHTIEYSPIVGSSYMTLPHKISASHSVVNIKNDDQKCFLWSVLAALHPISANPQRVSHYQQYENELNMKNIDYPVSLGKLEKFENQNNMSINVFGYEKGCLFPLFLTKKPNGCKEVDLLLVTDEINSHYCLIKSLDRLLASQQKFHTRRYHCRRCLHGFIRKDLLNEHRLYCNKFDFQKMTYPTEGKNDELEFKKRHTCMKVPFVIYADFESLIEKVATCQPNPEVSSTTHKQKHSACGYSYVVVCSNDKYSKPPVVYRGNNAVDHLLNNLMEEETYIREKLNEKELLIMSEETEQEFQEATHCNICVALFSETNIKVRDHDHLGVDGDVNSSTYSNYRGATCQSCNLQLKARSFIPVIMHNLKGYDSHLLLSEATNLRNKKITCIANNMEKYLSFSIGNLRFLDSYQFMGSSLETLVENLTSVEGDKYFKQFRKAFPSEEQASLLLQKNEYCYDYIDSFAKFEETELPSREAFFNHLTNEPLSEERYTHAREVWDTFNMKTIGEYHDIYVKSDALLLCDVFERFREMTLECYKLDACHFFSAPGLAWQAALKMTNVCLELIVDPIMYNMFELGTRGGVSMVSKKYAKANNKYLKDFDTAKPSTYIMYFDKTNLYGHSMQQPLPTGLMRFLNEEELEQFEPQKITEHSKLGYICEVDLEYPEHLHDSHNCFPLAPEHKRVSKEELSPFSHNLWTQLNGEKTKIETTKLIPTLTNKKNYIVHYKTLALYCELGLKISKTHRVLEFHHSPWLKTYIDFNSNMRKSAKNDFEKDFFKLMCNSVYGKSLESLRSRVNIQLVTNERKLQKYVGKPSFKRLQIFHDNLVGVENQKVNLLLCNPLYLGQTILDLSKHSMYEFHYKVIQPMYGENIKLLFTDTDSLCYEIRTQDVYKDLSICKQHFDFSNYPENHPLFSTELKKVPGSMKDELNSHLITEICCIRPKMNSFLWKKMNKSMKVKQPKES